MTVAAGFAAIFFLGDCKSTPMNSCQGNTNHRYSVPENAKWLSDRQRHVALARVQGGLAST